MSWGYNNNNYLFTTRVLNPFRQPECPNPPSESISKISWVPNPQRSIFACSSWDCTVRSYRVDISGNNVRAVPLTKVSHRAPVLCCHATNDGRIFTGGCDNIGKCIALPGVNLGVGNNNNVVDLMKHDNCIKAVCCVPEINLVVSGGWDKKLRYWDSRLNKKNHHFEYNLPERVYAMDVKKNLLVVCCGGRNKGIGIFDLRKPRQCSRQDKSPLRLLTRCVKILPDGLGAEGYVLGSIEGRVAVQFLSTNRKSFAFKCHREGGAKAKKNCFAVNDIDFHPKYKTCATCGSNGRFSNWDMKKQIRVYGLPKRITLPITAGQFNPQGTIYAMAVGYDFTQGTECPAFKEGFGSKLILQRVNPNMHR